MVSVRYLNFIPLLSCYLYKNVRKRNWDRSGLIFARLNQTWELNRRRTTKRSFNHVNVFWKAKFIAFRYKKKFRSRQFSVKYKNATLKTMMTFQPLIEVKLSYLLIFFQDPGRESADILTDFGRVKILCLKSSFHIEILWR